MILFLGDVDSLRDGIHHIFHLTVRLHVLIASYTIFVDNFVAASLADYSFQQFFFLLSQDLVETGGHLDSDLCIN